jgi:Fe-S cluster assembly protein SufD
MNLKERIISVFQSDAKVQNSSSETLKSSAFENFKKAEFPSKSSEDWKYTSVKSLLKRDFSFNPESTSELTKEDIEQYFLSISSHKIVLLNGRFSKELSSYGDEFEISSLADKVSNDASIVEKLDKIAPSDNIFVNMNSFMHEDGIYLEVKNNQIAEIPVQILNLVNSSEKAALVQAKNYFKIGNNAEVKIVELYKNISDTESLSNPVTEIEVGENSFYYHHKIQNDNDNANYVDNTYVAQGRYSNTTVDTFTFSGDLIRNNLSFFLNGEDGVCNMYGITLLDKNQHVDNFTFVDHRVPNCVSNELYKGIYDDNSKGVFTGKIFIHKDAQKTNGYQQNNNLILSENAQINTKPQLEIFADDVKASHGCTIGQLDEEALFFLRSRGIPNAEARALLMFAFASEALENIKIEEVRVKITQLIAKKLKVDIDFSEY